MEPAGLDMADPMVGVQGDAARGECPVKRLADAGQVGRQQFAFFGDQMKMEPVCVRFL